MKRFLFFITLIITLSSPAQQLTLKKGVIMDNIAVADSIAESFALYLPASFETDKEWPVLFVFDMKGRGRQALSMFVTAAEEQGYVLAASNHVNDSLPISNNILISSRLFNVVNAMLPIGKNRVYTAGFANGARLASLVPTFIKKVQGTISCGSPIANTEVLSTKNPFHFIGITGNADYNYPEMMATERILDKLKFPNQLLVFEGGHEWPPSALLAKAMQVFTLSAMAKGNTAKNDGFVDAAYNAELLALNALIKNGQTLRAAYLLDETMQVYKTHKNIDSLERSAKTLKRSRGYKNQYRAQNAVLLKESFIKEEYVYYLEEDILTYNYNNLGWWNYQMEELAKFNKSANGFERQMGKRLKSYINALIADNIDMANAQQTIDLEALNFLWMLKTITDPQDETAYLKVISNSAKMEDYGTALFYLEELLKKGYTNKAKLYDLEDTALFRITPEFNTLVEKYLKEARYEGVEE